MTTIGELKDRITIRRSSTAANEFNELIETWSDLVTVWAKRTDAGGAEALRAQEVGAQIDVRFLIRHSSDVANVDPKDRVQFDGREYNITRVIEVKDTHNQWREISAVVRAEG